MILYQKINDISNVWLLYSRRKNLTFRTFFRNKDENPVKIELSESEKRRIRVDRRCREKAKLALCTDRLKEDKNYLTTLSNGIG
jgi:hypothetical protein